ncbi:hypothetical protein [Niastella populi]|uniref:DUF304 domain-containing protein n=1 Tax=Niastella populi TaxID=550983 RepID=A0A1V9GB24_9BACT|nr:hypothetical protein [Niastella populi]OQP67668.1 hypothetical protein A4R26_32945 [Niastella populi]
MTQPDTIAKSFRIELKTEIPYWLIILPSLFLLGIITKPEFIMVWPFALLLTVVLLFYSASTFRLTSIDINKGEAILTETNLLKSKRIKSYPVRDLQFTYKIGKPGLRHRVVNICRLYLKDKEVASIIPDHDGWTDDTVNDLAKGLASLGVAKKFIGYGSKDAEINGL